MNIHSVKRASRGNGACELSHLTFVVEDIDVSLANAIRRVVLSAVPNVSMHESTNFSNNTCALHNEFLAHRLSLIPICFSEKEIESFSDDPDRYTFVLNKKNATRSTLAVTSKDFQVHDHGKPLARSEVERLFPPNAITGEHILITQLKPNLDDPSSCGDEIGLEAKAVLGTAKVHACFSPVSLCTFFNVVDENAAQEARRIFVNKNKNISADAAMRRFDALNRDRHFMMNDHGEPRAFSFALESECRMRPEYILLKSLHVLRSEVDALIEDALPSAKISNVVRAESKESNDGAVVTFNVTGFDHTIGNLAQATLYNLHIRNKSSDVGLLCIGYTHPHPLDDAIEFTVQFKNVDDPDIARDRFRTALKCVISEVLDPFGEVVRQAFSLQESDTNRSPRESLNIDQ